jgi:hypothetical protein
LQYAPVFRDITKHEKLWSYIQDITEEPFSEDGLTAPKSSTIMSTKDQEERLLEEEGLNVFRKVHIIKSRDQSVPEIYTESDERDEPIFPERLHTHNRVKIVGAPQATDTLQKDSIHSPIKGILRKPTKKFPEGPIAIREGVASLRADLDTYRIPPSARWTKIDRRLVNPAALEEANERFEGRLDCVIVLRVLTTPEIQWLADRTRAIRAARNGQSLDHHE